MHEPDVSVILPVYNGEPYLLEALRSVRQQTHPAYEILVVDDGSTDASASIARAVPTIRCLRQRHQGAAAARNAGIRMATGSIIAFLDADDLWLPNTLQTQLQCLWDSPATEVVVGHTQCIRKVTRQGGGFEAWSGPRILPLLGSAVFRRSAVARIGELDETFLYCDDLDWFMRIREQNVCLVRNPKVVLHYRIHESNMTLGKSLDDIRYTAAVKRSLDRRRGRVQGQTAAIQKGL